MIADVEKDIYLTAKEKCLRNYESLLSGELLFEKSITSMLLVNSERTIIKGNQQFFKLFGYQADEIIGLKTSVLTPTLAHFEKYKAHFEKMRDGTYQSSELLYKKKDNSLFWVKLTGIPIAIETENFILWSIDDITQEVIVRKEIKNRNRELEIIFGKVKVGLVYETNGIIERVNRSFLTMQNVTKRAVIGKRLVDFIGNSEHSKNAENKKVIKFYNKKNKPVFVEHDIVTINKHSHINIFSDITDHITEKERFKVMAQIDGLTQIFNRAAFVTLAQNMLSENQSDAISFVMCDIDFFKQINDEHGHDVGDEVLVELAELISSQLRASEFFGRLGGEEFGVIFPISKDKVRPICERLLFSIRNHHFTSKNLKITVSMGVVDSSCTDDFDILYKKADEMLYKAKEFGKDQVIL